MKSAIFAVAALAGAANAWGNYSSSIGTGAPTPVVITTTDVVTSYTTYCPYATSIVQGNETYTATSVSDIPVLYCKRPPANICPGNNPHNHQLPLHPNSQDNRHTLRNHHNRNCHLLHHLLPSGHHCCPKQQNLHSHRVRNPHHLRMPMHSHQDRDFHSWRARHLHWYCLQHHRR